jgi:sugar O-acyltransferase (sialic acid O-acetyltransferase NeuD family)
MKQKIVIIGAGGFGREVFSIINREQFDIVGFIDNNIDENNILPAPIIGSDEIIPHLKSEHKVNAVCIALGNMNIRSKLFQIAQAVGLDVPTIIHPSATVLSKNKIGDGTIIYPNVVIMDNCCIGNCVLINSGITLGHDVIIGDFSSINPGANLAGRIKIGRYSMIGIGACIKENLTIGDNVIVGAGSVVVKSVESDRTVFGVPATVKNKDISSI